MARRGVNKAGIVDDLQIKALFAGKKPYKSYIKTILGKVQVFRLNPFDESVEAIILFGNPREKNKETCIIDAHNEKEERYLKSANRKHFERGILMPFERTVTDEVKTEEEIYNTLSDEELKTILSKPFMSMLHSLDKITSTATIYRMITLAEELEKSEKYAAPIHKRLEELQRREYSMNVPEEEKRE